VLDALLERRESVRTSENGMFAVGAPLLLPGRVLGLVYVMRWSPAPPFDGDDRMFLCLAGHLVATALAQAQREGTLARAVEAARGPAQAPPLLGDSEPMRALRDRIERFAASDAAILIRGESGSGKELVARALHARSPRADGPFVAVNCAAIPESLIESELFGHDRGAFTGAGKAVRGKFALADGGTLFLDEVGDLGAAAQAKVLRAIEEGEVTPIGSEETLEVDVRVVSATHKLLEEEIAVGRFRSDLYYRLAVAEIAVPPLGARGNDVVVLAGAFLARAARRLGREVRGFTPDALATLPRQAWPGNVRQLANEIERALLLEDGEWIGLDDLRARTAAGEEGPPRSLGEHERQLVQRALADAGGNVRAAAKALEISRNTLYRKLKKYGIGQE